jgi:hypothetical protein
MRYAVRSALIEPLNLAFLALAVVAGLAEDWRYLLLGLALYIYLVHLAARDPIVQVHECLRRRPPFAAYHEAPFARIEQAYGRLDRALARATPARRRALRPLQAAWAEVVGAACRTGQRATALETRGRPAAAPGGARPGEAGQAPDAAVRCQTGAAAPPLDGVAVLLYRLGNELEDIATAVACLPEEGTPQAERAVTGWVQALRLHRQQLEGIADSWSDR